MTLSYRIIKSENLQMSQEGVQISRAEPVKKVEHTEQVGNLKKHSPLDQAIPLEEKDRLISQYKESLENEKKEILKEIQLKAEKESLEAIETAREKGFQQGHQEGFQKGYDEALDESRKILDQARQSLQNAQNEVLDYLEREKENIIRLAGHMAERIVNHEIDLSSQSVIDMLNPVLQEFRKGGTVIIYCNRRHLRKLKESIFSLKKINSDLEYLIIDNPQLENNEFNLEYDNQIIDLEIKGQIQSMVQQLLDLEV